MSKADGGIDQVLSHSELLQLKRWNTPSIYNGWEQITRTDKTDGFKQPVNLHETRDFMPQMGPMVGYAVTVVIEPSNLAHKQNKDNVRKYREYVASLGAVPKIVVVKDLDRPHVGAFWGEVQSNLHRALGCVGTITEGSIRDLDEMTNAGFKAIASRLSVGHAHMCPIEWNVPVEVFGRRIEPGQLIHADKHGFLVVPRGDEKRLLEATTFMDANECSTIIPASRGSVGVSLDEKVRRLTDAGRQFGENARWKFGGGAGGEWDSATAKKSKL